MRGILFGLLRRLVGLIATLVLTYLALCVLLLAAYRVTLPPITTVQVQRAIEASLANAPYSRQYRPVAPDAVSRHLPRAVIAAEDGRFYLHNGIDWEALREVREEVVHGGRMRGGSTITQQLVKNLFLTTHRSFIRKGLEVPLAYAAELLLSKDRLVHLYVNVVEWGPGVFGAEAAAQHHFGIPAADLSRTQSAGLAACLPAPRTRTPKGMESYTNIIEQRMAQHGW
ncbi:MAG: monofunctional biosynthetic peptidoglycan transglycosylase [Bacteroidetes bacterium]|jgi:monofunctional biosynthetic peptidoglycan transglycosylase|nr:monofunctional biosynthetic peptidoglycan transglycosylase [Bacteroidota bacterium]